jgi:tetratricopeptide (TPR) repeat protein
MRTLGANLLVWALAVMAPGLAAADPSQLARARVLYNEGRFDDAIMAAREARDTPDTADIAAVVLARAHLERYRTGADPTDLGAARDALGAVRADQLDASDRLDFLIALGASLFLEDDFGAAANLFDSALMHAGRVRPEARETVLDWLGSAVERRAASLPAEARIERFRHLSMRMEAELAEAPGSRAAAYWLVAALRGQGALVRAWDAAVAGWVRARLAGAESAALRADLDALVLEGLIPDLADQANQATRDARRSELRADWELIKQKWR